MSAGDLSTDDVNIDVALVRRLVAAQFPQWADLLVAPVAKSGVDNATYRLGEDMSVRLPRFPRWVGQVEREQRWLPRLAAQLPLAVPVPLAQGEPGDGKPPPGWSNGFRGVPIADERDSPVVETRVRGRIAALDGLVDTDAVTAVFEAALAAPAWDAPPVWIHGDPAPTNMLATDGRLSAVIDFGTLAVGDPSCDLIAAWTFLDAETRDVFRAALSVDDATWARGRGWGLTGVLPSTADLADHVRAPHARRRLDDIVADLRLSSPATGK